MNNPFTKHDPSRTFLKVLLFGAAGSGKTVAALSFPKPAVIDLDGGSVIYNPTDVFRASTPTEVESAVAFIREDNGRTFQTLVIDPITTIYDYYKGAIRNKHGDHGYAERAKINDAMKAFYAKLVNLPVHLVVIAREEVNYVNVGKELKADGVKPDADKSVFYPFDYVVRVRPDHLGEPYKIRGNPQIDGKPIRLLRAVNWATFQRLLSLAQQQASNAAGLSQTNDTPAEEQEAPQISISEEELDAPYDWNIVYRALGHLYNHEKHLLNTLRGLWSAKELSAEDSNRKTIETLLEVRAEKMAQAEPN